MTCCTTCRFPVCEGPERDRKALKSLRRPDVCHIQHGYAPSFILVSKYDVKELRDQHEKELFTYPEVYNSISAKEIMLIIKELPINTGLVFNMYVMEGYKHNEIADKLGIQPGTSKWHLNEARKLLKNKLDSLLTTKSYANAI